MSFVPGTHFYRQKTKYTEPAPNLVTTIIMALQQAHNCKETPAKNDAVATRRGVGVEEGSKCWRHKALFSSYQYAPFVAQFRFGVWTASGQNCLVPFAMLSFMLVLQGVSGQENVKMRCYEGESYNRCCSDVLACLPKNMFIFTEKFNLLFMLIFLFNHFYLLLLHAAGSAATVIRASIDGIRAHAQSGDGPHESLNIDPFAGCPRETQF